MLNPRQKIIEGSPRYFDLGPTKCNVLLPTNLLCKGGRRIFVATEERDGKNKKSRIRLSFGIQSSKCFLFVC